MNISLRIGGRFGRWGDEGQTYAGARVVFRKVDLQIWHWMSIAFSLTFSCDLATLVSLSLRSRFDAAFAPCHLNQSLDFFSAFEISSYVSHVCGCEERATWLMLREVEKCRVMLQIIRSGNNKKKENMRDICTFIFSEALSLFGSVQSHFLNAKLYSPQREFPISRSSKYIASRRISSSLPLQNSITIQRLN